MKPAYRVPDNDCAGVEPGTVPAVHAADPPLAACFQTPREVAA